jgi:uncharacterized protein YggU (UPF0235/DUF167 family)
MTEIYVKVEPNSEEFEVEKGDMPKFKLENRAENGRANTELVKRIHELTGEKPGIVSGHSSRRKKIKIDLDKEEFMEKITGGEK